MAMRSLRWAGRAVRLLGVEGYNSGKGGDAIYCEVEALRPGVVLMESFAAEGEEVLPGGSVPYRKMLPATGLARALERVRLPEFRSTCSAEVVAALAALRAGADVRLGDRLHVTSFDRLVERRGLNELRHGLAVSIEAVAGKLEERLKKHGPPVRIADLPQNFVCPMFQELSVERHLLMAHFARRAAEEGHDVAVVVGAEHLDGLEGRFGETAADVEELLQGGAPEAESDAKWEEELEKRCAAAAFLASTGAFPPEVVLPPFQDLLPEAKALASKFYPKYSKAFRDRLSRAAQAGDGGSRQDLQAALDKAAAARVRGLPELKDVCLQLQGAVSEESAVPPTPPPPPGRR